MTPPDTPETAGKTLRTSDNASDPAVSWKVKCLNCGAALAGPFCAECGQRVLPPHPDVRELVGDAVAEFSGWDGKFAQTVRLLVTKPGGLTRQWLDGRRAHFISPLRLYLTASLVYFLAAAAAPNLPPGPNVIEAGGVRIGIWNGPARTGSAARASQDVRAAQRGALTDDERRKALASIDSAPALIRPILKRAMDDPIGLRASMLSAMPKVLFGLLPIFAGIVALFYRRRHYPEHLYFAIHLSAFIFVALTLSELSKMTHVVALPVIGGAVAKIWIVAYSTLALRKVYGNSLAMTVLKGLGIAVLYCAVSVPALIGLVAWAATHH
jgi:hypothetical protein